MENHEYMLIGLQMLIDECRRTENQITDIKIDNENEKIIFKLKDSRWDLVFEDGTWDYK